MCCWGTLSGTRGQPFSSYHKISHCVKIRRHLQTWFVRFRHSHARRHLPPTIHHPSSHLSPTPLPPSQLIIRNLQERPSSSSTLRYASARPNTAMIEYTLSLSKIEKNGSLSKSLNEDRGKGETTQSCILLFIFPSTEPRHLDSLRES